MASRPLLISIVGPTASGKSKLALSVALALGGEIVNCDSVQLYRDLQIGTGKPPDADLKKIPHHLLSLLPPTAVYSAGQMQHQARAAIEEVAARGSVPVLVGGTGFYYRAILFGLPPVPQRSPVLRERLGRSAAQRGNDHLVRMLRRVDPASAGRIKPQDRVRIVRALEVYFLSGRPVSELRQGDDWLERFRWMGFSLEPERSDLYGRIGARVRWMLENGWVEEVRRLLESGVDPSCKAFEAIGYRHVVDHLAGRLTCDQLEEQICLRTRQYAKRQMTWFRRERGLVRLEGGGEDPAVAGRVLKMLASGLDQGKS